MVSIRDVAKHAKCSTSTVSRVLNSRDAVDKDTRQRVLNAIEELNYKPNLIATGLRVNKGNLIGVVVPDDITHSFSAVTHSSMEVARSRGFNVLFGCTKGNPKIEAAFIDDLLRRNVNGIIFSRVSDESRIMTTIQKKNIPIVIIDRTLEQEGTPHVVLDNVKAGQLAARHLGELGHRHVCCITGPLNIALCRDRLRGFKEGLKEFGIPESDIIVQEGNFKFDSGVEAVDIMLKKRRRLTAMWAMNDIMALGALRELQKQGMRVPHDISLMGMDDQDICEMVYPSLTTVHYPFDLMVDKAMTLLINHIESGEPMDSSESSITILEPSLVVRESTKRIDDERKTEN